MLTFSAYFVLVINGNQIYGFHLFWDTLYIRPGLQIISLHRLLQCFSMRQTKQRDYHNPAYTYYNTQFSAVEKRLHSSKHGVLQYCLGGKPPSAINLYEATRPLILYVNCNSIFQWTISTFKNCNKTTGKRTTNSTTRSCCVAYRISLHSTVTQRFDVVITVIWIAKLS